MKKKSGKSLDISAASQALGLDNKMLETQLDKNAEMMREYFENNLQMWTDLQNLLVGQIEAGATLLEQLSPELIETIMGAGTQLVDDSVETLREKMMELRAMVEGSSLPTKDKNKLTKSLDTAIEKTPTEEKVPSNNDKKTDLQNKKLRVQKDLLRDIVGVSRDVGDAFGENNKIIGDVASVMGAVASGALGVISTIGTTSKATVGGIVGGSKAAAASVKTVETASIILAVISSALQVVTAIMDIFSGRAKEREAQLKQEAKAQRTMLKSEIEYQKALSDRLYLEKEITSEKIKQAKQNLKASGGSADKAYDAAMKQYNHLMYTLKNEKWSASAAQDVLNRANGFKQLANTIKSGDKDRLDTLEYIPEKDREAWDDYKRMAQTALDQQQKWRDELKEIANGITGSASDYMSEFVQALQEGEEATYNFAESFKKRMRDAIISGLAENLIFAKIDGLLKKVQDQVMGENGVGIEGITKDMMDSWKSEFEGIQEESLGVSKVIGEVLDGLGLDSISTNKGLSNSIQSVSEETASVISGQMNAMRSAQLRQIDISTQQLNVLKEISAINTSNQILEQSVSTLSQIATNTKHLLRLEAIERSLEQINKGVNSSGSQSTLKSQGISGL